jgi:hypothetical protein
MSAAKKGQKGRTQSEETKSRISDARKGRKLSDEHKTKISASSYNKGKPVYLYTVHPYGLELASTHFNTYRLVEFLGVPYSTLYGYIKNRTLFKVHGLSYIASRDPNLT